jgi:hypothetical protein
MLRASLRINGCNVRKSINGARVMAQAVVPRRGCNPTCDLYWGRLSSSVSVSLRHAVA